MIDYELLRKRMVQEQLSSRDITDKNVLEVFAKVQRHEFIPDNLKSESYSDRPLPIGENQTISQPYIVALMVQLLELKGKEKVLEIGTGSGYETAILAELASCVYTVERIDILSGRAQDTLARLGYENINFKIGDGTEGWTEFAPYQRIVISAASCKVPEPLLEQLTDMGIMVIPIGEQFNQVLTIIKKIKGKFYTELNCSCAFVPLVGKYA